MEAEYKKNVRILNILETSFSKNIYPEDGEIVRLSKVLGRRKDCIQYWFSCRRMRLLKIRNFATSESPKHIIYNVQKTSGSSIFTIGQGTDSLGRVWSLKNRMLVRIAWKEILSNRYPKEIVHLFFSFVWHSCFNKYFNFNTPHHFFCLIFCSFGQFLVSYVVLHLCSKNRSLSNPTGVLLGSASARCERTMDTRLDDGIWTFKCGIMLIRSDKLWMKALLGGIMSMGRSDSSSFSLTTWLTILCTCILFEPCRVSSFYNITRLFPILAVRPQLDLNPALPIVIHIHVLRFY